MSATIDVVADNTASRKRRGKQIWVFIIVLALLTAAVFYGVHWWQTGRFVEETDDAYVGGDISVMSAKVSGYVAQIAVTDNQRVKKGDLLVKLDDRDYRAALAQAEGNVAAQRAQLTDLAATRQLQLANIASAQATALAAEAETRRTRDDNHRYSVLSSSAAVSVQSREKASADYQQAAANEQKANADITAAQRQLAVLDARKQQAQAALDQAIAQRDMAQLNLSYTEIRAPFDGNVGNRRAQMGAYVSSGVQLLSLVPEHGLWIDANFKENQLTHMRAGQPADITADIMPGRVFHGYVGSLSPATGSQFSVLPAENATGNFTKIVQRVPVRILLVGDDANFGILRPGLSVTVDVNEQSGR